MSYVFVPNTLPGRERNSYETACSTAETRGIKERKGGEQSAAEGDERGEGIFPLAAQYREHDFLLAVVPRKREEHGLAALHEEQEREQSAEQRYEEPPVML